MSQRRTPLHRRLVAATVGLAVGAATLVGSAAPAGAAACSGATRTWFISPGASTAWTATTSWVGGIVPDADDSVVLPSGASISGDAVGEICALEAVGNIAFSGNLDLDITGNLNLGRSGFSGTINLTSTAPAPASRRLLVRGTTTLVNTVQPKLSAIGLDLAGGTLDLKGNSLTLTGAATSRLGPGSSVTSSTASTAAHAVVVSGSARLAVAGGATVTSPASVQLQAGSTLGSDGAPATLGGTGLLSWQAGDMTGDLTLGLRTVTDGSGPKRVPAGSRLTADGLLQHTAGTLQVDGALVNRGTLRVTPAASITSPAGTGSLTNEAAGTLAIGATDTAAATGDVRLTDVPLLNSGAVTVVAGTRLLLEGSRPTASRLLGGSVVRDPLLGAGTRGVLQVGAGASLTLSGATTLQQGAVLRLDDGADGTAGAVAGQPDAPPTLAGVGTFEWRSGTVRGPLTTQAVTDIAASSATSRRFLEGSLGLDGSAVVTGTTLALRPGASVRVQGSTSLIGTPSGFERTNAGIEGQSLTVLPGGTLRRAAPTDGSTGPAVVDVPLANHGSLSVSAPLAVRAGFTQVKAPGGDPAATPDPVTSLLGGTARITSVDSGGTHQPLTLAAGGIGGTGVVETTSLTLGRTFIHPGLQSSAGQITVEGDLRLSKDSDVQIVMRDATATQAPKGHDVLEVVPLVVGGIRKAAGKATLAGKITGASAGTYKPSYGTTVQGVLRFAQRSGSFATTSSFGTPNGLGWRPRYDIATSDGDGLGVDLRLSDVAPPALGVASVPPFTQRTSQRLTYAGVDNRTGVATYDVRWREGSPGRAFTAWKHPKAWRRTTDTAVTLTDMKRGWTSCASIRTRDKAGNVSAWTEPLCTTRMADDRGLAASTGWTRSSGQSGLYQGTTSRALKKGSTLRTAGTYTRLAVTAVRCPACGRAQVMAGSTVLKTIGLRSKKTETFTWASRLRPQATGRVTITVLSRGKPVIIDAFGLSR